MLYGICAATVSFLLAALLAALLRLPTQWLGVVERRRRRPPVPLSGGLAVVLVTALVAGAGERTGMVPLGPVVGGLLVAGAAAGLLGLAADLWKLRRRWVLAGTAVAAAWVVPYEETGIWAGVLGVLWITGAAGAFRGLDHADGVAGTVGVVTAFGVGACAAAEVMDGVAVLLSVLAAALAGSLLHNWPPARTGLGACGTLFTGFLLAAAALLACAGRGPGGGAGTLFALTAVLCGDVALVALSRWLAGRPPLRSGPDHLVHRLRRLGLTARGAVVLTAAGAFGGVLTGVLVHTGRLEPGAVLWVAGAVAAVVLGLTRVRVYGPRRGSRNGSRSGRGAAKQSMDFPVRQTRRPASTQVRGSLRVRNG
ncbi:undecaprenyl/decaprenyl-phosphate alpha-N-acetylglucosaminyl 1-phosphate transferase [Streptomyces sp. NPDC005876]|uniref:undecaprenyl/decaprenyl-phosphate alpha-N-acetylglucosaminyl 1-phosphate transferase n=1 Tax=Streptomyces sp. NPDC005876 TaxID=3157076 RepID=UPI0033D3CAA3